MSGSDREGMPDVWEWSVGPRGCPGVVGMSSGMSGSGREVLRDVREWLGVPPGCPGVVGSPSQISGSGREALPDFRDLVGRECRMFGIGQEVLEDVREWSRGPRG